MSIQKRPGDFEYFLLIEIQDMNTGNHHLIDGGCYAQNPREARAIAMNLGRDICTGTSKQGLDCRLIGYTVKPCLAVIYEEISNDKTD